MEESANEAVFRRAKPAGPDGSKQDNNGEEGDVE